MRASLAHPEVPPAAGDSASGYKRREAGHGALPATACRLAGRSPGTGCFLVQHFSRPWRSSGPNDYELALLVRALTTAISSSASLAATRIALNRTSFTRNGCERRWLLVAAGSLYELYEPEVAIATRARGPLGRVVNVHEIITWIGEHLTDLDGRKSAIPPGAIGPARPGMVDGDLARTVPDHERLRGNDARREAWVDLSQETGRRRARLSRLRLQPPPRYAGRLWRAPAAGNSSWCTAGRAGHRGEDARRMPSARRRDNSCEAEPC